MRTTAWQTDTVPSTDVLAVMSATGTAVHELLSTADLEGTGRRPSRPVP